MKLSSLLNDASTLPKLACFGRAGVLTTLILVTACSDSGVQVYQVAREDSPATPTASSSSPNTSPSANSTATTTADTTANLSWPDPDGWEVVPASSMVIRSYQKEISAGSLKLSISAFPGDVGGDLPNVNRWRRQLGLAAVTPEALDSVLQQQTISGRSWKQISITNDDKAQLTAYTMSAGKTWFFKITGPTAAVESITDWFDTFLADIQSGE